MLKKKIVFDWEDLENKFKVFINYYFKLKAIEFEEATTA
jgi:hypothetical protein